MRTLVHALLVFSHSWKPESLKILTDKITVVLVYQQMGRRGVRACQLCRPALLAWEQEIEANLSLHVIYISSQDNVLVETLSRSMDDPHKWMLSREFFLEIVHRWGMTQIELYASIHNKWVKLFWSSTRCPQSWRMDIMSFTWVWKFLRVFPPTTLNPRGLFEEPEGLTKNLIGDSLLAQAALVPLFFSTWPRVIIIIYPRVDLLTQKKAVYYIPTWQPSNWHGW